MNDFHSDFRADGDDVSLFFFSTYRDCGCELSAFKYVLLLFILL